MRLTTWNCCWKLEQKLTPLLNEAPDLAVIQECSQASLENLPDGYRGHWLHGAADHGLGLLYREPYMPTHIIAADQPSFVRIDIAGPIPFRLIAAWNCPPKGTSYIAHLHNFLNAHLDGSDDWFDREHIVFAGDLNSQQGASFDTGKRKHKDFADRLQAAGLVDMYAAVRGIDNPTGDEALSRRATYHHQRKLDQPFHLDYIFAPESWLPRISSLTVGAPSFWSRYSDHSPVTIAIA